MIDDTLSRRLAELWPPPWPVGVRIYLEEPTGGGGRKTIVDYRVVVHERAMDGPPNGWVLCSDGERFDHLDDAGHASIPPSARPWLDLDDAATAGVLLVRLAESPRFADLHPPSDICPRWSVSLWPEVPVVRERTYTMETHAGPTFGRAVAAALVAVLCDGDPLPTLPPADASTPPAPLPGGGPGEGAGTSEERRPVLTGAAGGVPPTTSDR